MSDRFHTHAPGLPDAPKWLSVVVPATLYPALVLSIFVARPVYDAIMYKEGPIEYLGVAFLLMGVGYGVTMLVRYREHFPERWLTKWYALVILAMFVLAGEEISWGQHLGLWDREDVPEAIRAVNDQNETNLHNITNKLDQWPRYVLVGGTFVGYVVIPIYLRRRRETMGTDNPGYWFWPTRAGLIAALGAMLIPFPKRFYEWTTGEDASRALRHSELQESYIAILLTIYVVSAYTRLRGAAMAADAPETNDGTGLGRRRPTPA